MVIAPPGSCPNREIGIAELGLVNGTLFAILYLRRAWLGFVMVLEEEETIMRETHVKLPTIGLIAGTRVALGIGIGLLLADRLTPEQRQAAGWTLIGVGALTTIPLVLEVLGESQARGPDDLRVRRNPVSPYVTASGNDH